MLNERGKAAKASKQHQHNEHATQDGMSNLISMSNATSILIIRCREMTMIAEPIKEVEVWFGLLL